MKIRAIVCDMDGTLLKRTGGTDHIGERTRQARLEAQAQGSRLSLAAGRPHGRLMRYAQELHMPQHGGWLIEVNGTALYDLESGRREVLAQLHRAEIRELYAQLMQMECEVSAYQDRGLWYHIPKRLIAPKLAYRQAHGLGEDRPPLSGPTPFVRPNPRG